MRFAGSVQELEAVVDIAEVLKWILCIPFDDWPQQDPLPGEGLRPAMVNDPAWHGFGDRVAPLIGSVMPGALAAVSPGVAWPAVFAVNRMLSVVMPGASIPPHIDRQAGRWLGRVHVPLQADDRSLFIVERVPRFMRPGLAYLVNTEREHEIVNRGTVPRIHLMWDMETQC